jgi:FKBP-type peptidyl-prolyl cis-trans isomerase FklB
MKLLWTAAVMVGLVGCQSTGDKNVKLESKQDKISYSIGMSVGKNLRRDSISVVPDAFLRGVLDAALDTSRHLLTAAQIQETLMEFQKDLQTKQMENARVAGEKHAKEGEVFLAENAKKPGVVTLPSGLQYKVITEGKGASPKASSTVTTQYAGKLLDGTEFDSSYKRGEPATFPLGGVIKGWQEALQLMKPGAKWELYIPANLAWGEQGSGAVIPPNATVLFTVELISVK